MVFIADKQTLDDLNILGKYKSYSLYNLFNQVSTAGAERLLDNMFQQPLTNVELINARSQVLQYFADKALRFPFRNEACLLLEQYLHSSGADSLLMTGVQVMRKRWLSYLGLHQEYQLLTTGLRNAITVLNQLRDFLVSLQGYEGCSQLQELILPALQTLSSPRLQWLKEVGDTPSLSPLHIVRYDHALRYVLQEEMQQLLQIIYQLDVYIAVAGVGKAKGFSYAQALPAHKHTLQISGLYHPALEKAVPNDLTLDQEENVLFLTGANMAGKSTFMKSFGIAIYLAHMGFPVAATEMVFSVKDGIYSSINVPDNLQQGYSHFYAEVLHVKQVAIEVSTGKNLVVIFDELFKGTNVKDAYDATLAVSEAFATHRNCAFIISTHITEVGEQLLQKGSHFRFSYLPTRMKGNMPVYTYQLEEGISGDRHGMMIITNERIVDIILEDVRMY